MALIEELERTNHALRRHYALHHGNAPILRVEHLSVGYASGLALDDISFDLPRTMRLAVVGPNGAGKSTLLKVIAGIIVPTGGTVQVFGEAPGEHICIAYVPQRNQVDWNFPVTVSDVVMMGRISKLGLLRRPKGEDRKLVAHALEVVNLGDLARRQISELSGGQQQRMFIARALAQEAEMMLLDEPLTGLDVGSQEDVLHILDGLQQSGVTILVALHDLKLAASRFGAILLLRHRLIGFGPPEQVLSAAHLAEAYGSGRALGQEDLLVIDDTCCVDGHDHHD